MKDFEKKLQRLDEIIAQIESNETLADALELYKEGIALAAEAGNALNMIDKEIQVLEKGDENEL
ncbi:MAG: exodeoxyribonuclease VII small subunit [Defluviitaleaceae bacterium]|nr:exodeoxyribonuclease VII small subunit [Defluviitaleaceae bacterium]